MNSDIGRAECGRCHLHAQATRFIQHHRDIARTHEQFLFDLFLPKRFDTQRLILDAASRPCRLHDNFFNLLGVIVMLIVMILGQYFGRDCQQR